MRELRVAAVAVLLAGAGSARAAERPACSTDADVQSIPGKWVKKSQPDIAKNPAIPDAERPVVLKRLEEHTELVRKALGAPVGYDQVLDLGVGGKLFDKGPVQYNTTVYRNCYYCSQGRLFDQEDYCGNVIVAANSAWAMSGPEARFKIGGKNNYAFGSPIGEIRGFPAFQTDFHGPSSQTSWVVLVTRPGKNPLHLATRKELLDSLKARNEELRKEELDGRVKYFPVRPQAEQAKDKAKDLALFLKGAKDDAQRQHWTERFEKDYRTDEQKRDEALAKISKRYDRIRDHLAKVEARYTPEQLGQTAMSHENYIDHPDEDFDFRPTHEEKCGKGSCGEGHGRPFASPGPDYDAAAPASKPLFYTVSFTWDRANAKVMDPATQKLRDDFFAKFDFDALVTELKP